MQERRKLIATALHKLKLVLFKLLCGATYWHKSSNLKTTDYRISVWGMTRISHKNKVIQYISKLEEEKKNQIHNTEKNHFKPVKTY